MVFFTPTTAVYDDNSDNGTYNNNYNGNNSYPNNNFNQQFSNNNYPNPNQQNNYQNYPPIKYNQPNGNFSPIPNNKQQRPRPSPTQTKIQPGPEINSAQNQIPPKGKRKKARNVDASELGFTSNINEANIVKIGPG